MNAKMLKIFKLFILDDQRIYRKNSANLYDNFHFAEMTIKMALRIFVIIG